MLKELVEMSNRYGADEAYVLAGGGNTSCKDADTLYVKGSGTQLATITEEEFVAMDRRRLDAVFTKRYSDEDDAREAEVLVDMMDARLPGNEAKRPSVEAALHHLFPQRFVLHVHPAAVNGITCGAAGKEAADRLFGDSYIWIPICKPGYTLSVLCKQKMDEYRAEKGKDCEMILLQNHGVFFGADTVEAIDELAQGTMKKILDSCEKVYDFTPVPFDEDRKNALEKDICDAAGISPECVSFISNVTVNAICADGESFKAVGKPFSPDHVVYCKAFYLFTDGSDIAADYKAFTEKNGYAPRVIAVKGFGAFIACDSVKNMKNAHMLFLDACKIAEYSANFGGPLPMTDEMIDFITNWEVEAYRAKAAK